MKLNQSLEGKMVRITTTENEVFEGIVEDYIFADDNEPKEEEALIFDNLVRKSDNHEYEYPVEFTASEIKTLEVLE